MKIFIRYVVRKNKERIYNITNTYHKLNQNLGLTNLHVTVNYTEYRPIFIHHKAEKKRKKENSNVTSK